MSIPQILEIVDFHINKTMKYELENITKNNLLVYKNSNTGCRQAFAQRDFRHINGKAARMITHSSIKEEWTEI